MGGGRTSMGFDMDNAVEHYQALNPQTSEMWEQNRKIDHQTFKMLPPWRDHWKGLLEIAFPYHAMRARAWIIWLVLLEPPRPAPVLHAAGRVHCSEELGGV